MHHTQQLLPSVWVPDRWTDLPFPGFNGWQHIGCSWCVNECQGECFMDVDGICPVQSDSLEHKLAPLPSLADLGIILIFNLKVSGILGGICLLPDLFITTWSFRSVEVASRLPGFKVGGKKQILFQWSLNVLKRHVETSCRDSWNIYHVWQKYLLTKMCHGKSTVFLIVTSCTKYIFLAIWCFKLGIQHLHQLRCFASQGLWHGLGVFRWQRHRNLGKTCVAEGMGRA